jgi:hypothetical protein
MYFIINSKDSKYEDCGGKWCFSRFPIFSKSCFTREQTVLVLIFQFSVLLRCNGCFHFLLKMFSGKLDFPGSQGNLAITVHVLPCGFHLSNGRHPSVFHKITKLPKEQKCTERLFFVTQESNNSLSHKVKPTLSYYYIQFLHSLRDKSGTLCNKLF